MTIDKYKYGEDMKTATKELPVNFGSLRGANANAKITGPCGDTIRAPSLKFSTVIASAFCEAIQLY